LNQITPVMNFTKEAWDNCIHVLQVVARDLDASLDTDTLKGLVTKIYKKAKKRNKAVALQERVALALEDVENASLDKMQQHVQLQDVCRQYDRSLKEGAFLFRNYGAVQLASGEDAGDGGEFIYPRKCYCCKQPYKKVHFFYHMLCPDCAAFNYSKRSQRSDLAGRVALITGGRIKIGYLTALRMLRDGARVWVTTRFANDCARRFSREPDFSAWSHRLKIVSLDLRNLRALQEFINFLMQQESHLDIIINNAAQTIRRPRAFYEHLFAFEQQGCDALPAALREVIAFDVPFRFMESTWEQKLLPYEVPADFPLGVLDKDGQQVDRRAENSWSMLLDQVTPLEMLETQLVSVTAPFMINSSLKPLLCRSPFARRFIVNVSAMEGQFNRLSKTPYHPHTNMAKAALNMMTRTSAQDFAASSIFMNSVDTGWITQENPYPKGERLYTEEGFVPPLDETDGTARVYDPIAGGINDPETPLFGHFLKDYRPSFW
jgi:NAD(P)-dependent dehydrogenase (short-subunit alcohol dehydrogenase family)